MGSLERLHESIVEIIDIAEILTFILVRLAEDVVINKVKHNISKVGTTADTPLVQNQLGHRSILFQGVVSQTVEKLGATDMLGAFHPVLIFLTYLLNRVIEATTHKEVGPLVVSRVFFAYLVDDLGELWILHELYVPSRITGIVLRQ